MKYPKVIATKNNTFKLLEDYKINGFIIPKGTESDGLTLKLKPLRLLINKFEPKLQPFYFLHDYLTSQKKYKLADDESEKVLFKIEDSKRTRLGMRLIRIYHLLFYGAY